VFFVLIRGKFGLISVHQRKSAANILRCAVPLNVRSYGA
jgi:hypothetical protein